MKGFTASLLFVVLLPLADAALRYGNQLSGIQGDMLTLLSYQRAAAGADYAFQSGFRLAVVSGLRSIRGTDTASEAAAKVCNQVVEWSPPGVRVGRVNRGDFFDQSRMVSLDLCSCMGALRVENLSRIIVGTGTPTKKCVPVPVSVSLSFVRDLQFGRLASIVPEGTVVE